MCLVNFASASSTGFYDILANHKFPLNERSPNDSIGVRFYYMKGTSSENEKLLRISSGRPGSPCTEKHLTFNTEFTTEPICTASNKYQRLKIAALQSLDLPLANYEKQLEDIQAKECLCVGLSNAAALCYNETFINKQQAVNICPGPNIVHFSKVVTLQAMTDHIYGRKEIPINPERPHMFIAELSLYLDYLQEQIEEDTLMQQFEKKKKYYQSFFKNLQTGINYYRQLENLTKAGSSQFTQALNKAEIELAKIGYQCKLVEIQEQTITL